MKLDILVFAAHPDDAELGCGATIIKHVEMGYKVGVIDLTRGELGTRGDADIRQKEAEKASKILGLSIRENLGFKDGWFKLDDDHKVAIIKKVRQYQPDIVITNAPNDRHPDHGRAASLVKEASWLSGLQKFITKDEQGEEQKAWRPNHLYHFIQFLPLEPDFVVDVKGYTDKKMEAVMAHSSQFYDPDSKGNPTLISQPVFLDLVKSRFLSTGNYSLIEYGEGFISAFKPAVKNLFDLI